MQAVHDTIQALDGPISDRSRFLKGVDLDTEPVDLQRFKREHFVLLNAVIIDAAILTETVPLPGNADHQL